MKASFTLIAAFSALLALTACGGGGSDAVTTLPPSTSQPTALTKTDTVIGTGATAAVGNTITVHYSGYLYNSNAADFKGSRFDSSIGGPAPSFALASNSLIEGWVQGVPGMKVGGKRTIIFPASLGYGSTAQNGIPANSGLVFDIELIAVK